MSPTANTALNIALPIAVGLVAVYLLLPRPRGLPRMVGTLVGIAGLALAGALLLRDAAQAPLVESGLFYAFSGLALLGGVSLVTQPNPARGAVSFALVVLSTCGLFLLQAAPFVMAGTIIIYAGAIVVTFLFVIMLSQQHGASDADSRSREPLLACVAGGLLLFMLTSTIAGQYDTTGFDGLLAATEASKPNLNDVREAANRLSARSPARNAVSRELDDLEARIAGPNVTAEQSAESFAKFRAAVVASRRIAGDLRPTENVPLSEFGGRPVNHAVGVQPLPAGNVAGLGRLLFSDYILAVEMAGTLLLVATIGAIAISHRSARRAA